MIKRKLKLCKGECKKETYIFAQGRCETCWKKEKLNSGSGKIHGADRLLQFSYKKQSKKPVQRPINKGRKPTGELKIFREIYNERPHACQVCDVTLPVFDHWNYMHVLSKGSFPKFRLLKECVVLACRDCHTQYDCGSTINDPKFKWVLELKETLKQAYYEKNSNP